jgi:hypothetical protein
MKIRNGFVSNSSSSSFILALPEGTTKDNLKEIMLEKMQVPKTSIISSMAEDMASCFANSIDSPLDFDKEIEDTKRYLKDYPSEDSWEKDWIKELEGYREKGMVVFRGGFCDDGDAAEQWLCYSNMEIDEEGLYFKNEGGY